VALACYAGLLQVIPTDWISGLGKRIGQVMYRFMGHRRRIALANLRMALGPQLDPVARRRILLTLMESLGVTMAELGHPQYLRLESLRRFVAIQGLAHLDNALKQGKGAILVSAHYGNFPLFLARLGLEGYPLGVIIRDPRHRPVARFLDGWRARFGVATLRDKPRWASVKDALALLQSNGVLVVHIDVNVSHGGDFVPFFGQWVPTFRGPALLSLRTGAPLLPTFIRRIHDIHHRLTIHPPLSLATTGDRDEDAWRLLWRLTQAAETAIREHPEQWWWIHRRFRKARPAHDVGRPLPDPAP
jgi:KDO2-lipid IV(A) lauroyltransferase